ncbi:hypothetical protein [Nocardia sp. NPDC046763]|uniref:hypothetical protein n=1 Tax=Nocardia sp. NPDC046763 TaxID=3155256 RepID=UPI0033BFBA8C
MNVFKYEQRNTLSAKVCAHHGIGMRCMTATGQLGGAVAFADSAPGPRSAVRHTGVPHRARAALKSAMSAHSKRPYGTLSVDLRLPRAGRFGQRGMRLESPVVRTYHYRVEDVEGELVFDDVIGLSPEDAAR